MSLNWKIAHLYWDHHRWYYYPDSYVSDAIKYCVPGMDKAHYYEAFVQLLDNNTMRNVVNATINVLDTTKLKPLLPLVKE